MIKTTQAFDINCTRVELTRVPVRRHEWDFREKVGGLGHPKEQALYEIRIGGELVGRAFRPHGWGKQSFAIEDVRDSYNSIVYGDGYQREEDRLFTLEHVAYQAEQLRREKFYRAGSKLPTRGEWRAYEQAEVCRKARDDAEDEKRRRQWEAERVEATRMAEERRLEVLGGLQSIDDRLGSQLSNYEASALREAIANFGVVRKP